MIITHVISNMLCSCPSQQLDQAEHIAHQYKAPQLKYIIYFTDGEIYLCVTQSI